MGQNNYLKLRDKGKTVYGCQNDYEGAVVIPYGVTMIDSGAFYGCRGLTWIDIPNSVTRIGAHAFSRCTSLSSIKIPNSVIEIEDKAFSDCIYLRDIDVDGRNLFYCSLDGVLYSKYFSKLIAVPGGKDSIEIPGNVTEIADNAFSGCTILSAIEIPNGVTKIGDLAFKDCMSLTSIVIPDGVNKIGDQAFSGCTSLTSIVFPESLARIGEFIFSSCTSLTEIHLRHKTPIDFTKEQFYFRLFSLNKDPFCDLDQSKVTIYVPKGSGEAYRNCGYYKEYKDIVEEEKY